MALSTLEVSKYFIFIAAFKSRITKYFRMKDEINNIKFTHYFKDRRGGERRF